MHHLLRELGEREEKSAQEGDLPGLGMMAPATLQTTTENRKKEMTHFSYEMLPGARCEPGVNMIEITKLQVKKKKSVTINQISLEKAWFPPSFPRPSHPRTY